MMNDYLTNNVKLDTASAYATAATTDVEGTGYDCSTYEGIAFYTKVGTAAANNYLKAQQSSDNGVADGWSDLEGSAVGVGASDEEIWLEIKRPTKKYVRAVLLRGTSTTANPIVALRYGPRSLPVDNTTAGTIHGEALTSPPEGTA